MFNNIDNLKLLDIFCAPSTRYRSFSNRFSHAIVIKLSGESIYDFTERQLCLVTNEALFIPKGSSYTVMLLSDFSEYVIINFDGSITAPNPEKFSLLDYPNKAFLSSTLPKLWLHGGDAQKFKCYSAFYSLLSFFLTQTNADYIYKSKAYKINPAVEYLHENIFSCDLKLGELHLICDMSDTYFRKIFKSLFGTSPQEYVTDKRLSRAENIISGGDYASIGDVSKAVGYTDALYFSRVFTKRYGICPSEYMRKTNYDMVHNT